MRYDNRDSGCGGVAVALTVVVVLILGVGVLVLVGLFSFRKAAQVEHQAVMARDAAMAAEKRARVAEEALAGERDNPDAETDPVSQVAITLDADGSISVDGENVDLEQLRRQLVDANSTDFVVQVDDECRFEHVSKVLFAFEEAGIDQPKFTPQ